jgi:hypothetical protein
VPDRNAQLRWRVRRHRHRREQLRQLRQFVCDGSDLSPRRLHRLPVRHDELQR